MLSTDRIDAYFAGKLSPSEVRAVFENLRTNPQMQEYFDICAHASRSTSNPATLSPQLSPQEWQVLQQSIIGRHGKKATVSTTQSKARGVFTWGLPALAMTCVLFAIGLPSEAPTEAPTLTAKGHQQALSPTIEVMCFDKNMQAVGAFVSDAKCPAPGYLKVAYSSVVEVSSVSVEANINATTRWRGDLDTPRPTDLFGGYLELHPQEKIEFSISSEQHPRRMQLTIEGTAHP